MNNPVVTIEHTLEELNTIVLALAEKPFKEVAGLISKLHAQAQPQIAAAAAQQQQDVSAPAAPAAAPTGADTITA
jgi:hypothetical protein